MAITKSDSVLQKVQRALVACSAEQLPDRELLRRFAHGHDQDAFAAVVRRHGGMVLNVCQRALHNPDDAEDIFQATFLALARRADARDWGESVAGWLYLVAYRL